MKSWRNTPGSLWRRYPRTPNVTSSCRQKKPNGTVSSTKSSRGHQSSSRRSVATQEKTRSRTSNTGGFMAKPDKMDRHLRCSLCGKSRDEVRKLIAGPTVYICDECVNLCNDIIAEDWE